MPHFHCFCLHFFAEQQAPSLAQACVSALHQLSCAQWGLSIDMHDDAICLCFCKVVLLVLNWSAGHIFSQIAVLIDHVSHVGAAVAVTNQIPPCDETALVSYSTDPLYKRAESCWSGQLAALQARAGWCGDVVTGCRRGNGHWETSSSSATFTVRRC